MTPREARRERRAAERKAKKLDLKKARLAVPTHQPAAGLDLDAQIQPRWNPDLEDEFPREVQIRNNAEADRRALAAGLPLPTTTPAFEARLARVREHLAQGKTPAPETEIGFVSQSNPAAPDKRAEINRQNASHSTGPRSIDGKLASSRNSLKHGLASGRPLIPGEDPAEFDSLLRALLDEHQPATPTEEILIGEMAQSHWLTQRAIRLQNECFTANGVNEKQLALFLRYQTTHERAFYKSLNALIRLKKDRARAERGFVSQRPPETHQFVRQTASEAGFVSQQAVESDLRTKFPAGFASAGATDCQSA